MKFLFIHQNFPAQFMHLGPALARKGHEVSALTLREFPEKEWNGIRVFTYTLKTKNTDGINPLIIDYESKIIRAEACMNAAIELKNAGYTPELIIAHPGWGEALFIKQVWPTARLKIYCEFFYHTSGYDVDFDDEFYPASDKHLAGVFLKNSHILLNLQAADAGLSPTNFQANTFPAHFRDKISAIHEGIDTEALRPNPDVTFELKKGHVLTRKNPVITFVARALEPYRGFHTFMRALPRLLSENQDATILIVGQEGIAYGPQPPTVDSWKQLMSAEISPKLSHSEASRIHFLGLLPRARFTSLLQVSSVHVYLTYPFVLSWSLIEAMSVGCAIVASDTEPVREVVEHNDTGLLVNFFDHDQLSNKITLLLNDERHRSALGSAARQLAIENYDLHSVCLPKQVKWAENG